MLLCMAPNDDAASSLRDAAVQAADLARAGRVPGGAAVLQDCHGLFDPYGLALDNYDTLGRYRTVDELGRPIDAHATLPPALGGATVANAVQLAQALATRPEFTNCMARTVLQYAMVDYTAPVEIPSSPEQPGCATVDVVQRYQRAGGKTFGDLVRATAATPAFVLRRAEP